MVRLKQVAVVLGATLAWGASAPAVQIPGGTYTNSFTGTASLYDVSGTYKDGMGGLTISFTVNMDERGKFTGQGKADIDDFAGYAMSGKLDVTGSGTVKSSKNAARMNLTIKVMGYVTVQGTTVKVTENVKAEFEIVPGSERMMGYMSGSVMASGLGKTKTQKIPRTSTYLDLPSGENGTWKLVMNLAPAGTKYTGTATAVLVRGKSVPLTVSGTYAAKSDTSKLLLKGQQGIAATIAAAFQNAQIQVQNLKGKALGQSPHTP